MTKLTKRLIESTTADDQDIVIWDDSLPGFGLRAKPTGVKTFIIQYRNRGGRSRRLSIGQSGKITLDQARKEAIRLMGQISLGTDPAEERQITRRSETLAQLADLYMKEHCQGRCKQSTIDAHNWLIKKYIGPRLGNRRLLELRRSDIAKLHADLRPTPYNANRALGFLRAMLNFAEHREVIPSGSNPAALVKPYPEKRRERYLSPEELNTLLKTIDATEAEGSIDLHTAAAIRLLIFTGCRLGEVLTLEWANVDLRNARLTLERHKADRNGAKIIPLNVSALELLRSVPREDDNPYVIVGREPGTHLINLQKPWRRVRAAAGIEDVRLHDLRHSFASFAVGAGISLPIIGGLLGHKSVQTTARYAHLANAPLKQASDLVGTIFEEAGQ